MILGDLLCASAKDADASHYKVLNAFRLVDSTLLEIPASHPHLKISLIGAVLCFFSKFQKEDQCLLELLTKAFIQTLLRLRYFHTVETDPRYETAEEFEERNPEVLHERHVCDIVNSTLDKLEQISTGTRSFTELQRVRAGRDAEPFEPPERRFRRPVKKTLFWKRCLRYHTILVTRTKCVLHCLTLWQGSPCCLCYCHGFSSPVFKAALPSSPARILIDLLQLM